MRKILLGLIALPLLLTSCKLSDLRMAEIKEAIHAPGSEEKGKALMKKMYVAHGGDNWDKIQTFEVDFKEEFYKLKFASPLPHGKANLKLAFVAQNYDGRMTFTEGKKAGEEWGMSTWESWTKKPGGEVEFKHSTKIKFWLPTYQYFIQFPFKIREATFIRHGGTRTIAGKNYEVLFASWNTDEPQKKMDQYQIYLNPETKVAEIIEYTIRGAGGWLHGACIYKGYWESNGVKIPKVMSILGPKVDFEDQKLFHQMEVTGVKFNSVPVDELTISNLKGN